ncbi:hypothetical protein ACFVAV_24525 [Nocardia sp. NPDC057663]|uniref:hypothetical protein n=1 Tax=Nocardia sp. NPDC057663 TaxID=3346201 RepID=UPI003670D26F
MITAFVLLVAPLCWLLVARTPRIRLRIGVILALLAVAKLAVLEEWLLPDLQLTTFSLLVVFDVVALIAGFMADARAGRRLSPAVVISLILGYAYCFIILAGTFMFVVAMAGEHARMPPSDILPPLPPGLTIVADNDQGCRSGTSSTYCNREFQIGSTGGASAREVADMMVRHLQDAGNWQLSYSEYSKWWTGTRREGWGFDRSTMHVWVEVRDGKTRVAFGDEAAN